MLLIAALDLTLPAILKKANTIWIREEENGKIQLNATDVIFSHVLYLLRRPIQ